VDLTAYVPKDMVDLLATFLPNRRADIKRLLRALADADWPQLQQLAEGMYALGNPYGFRQITTFGRLMREACARRDKATVAALITEYAVYLSEVTIVEVDAPVTRHKLSAAARRILLPSPPVEKRGRRRAGRAKVAPAIVAAERLSTRGSKGAR
jgi:hypothetical protein